MALTHKKMQLKLTDLQSRAMSVFLKVKVGTTLPRGAKILPRRLTQSNSRDIFFSPNGDRIRTTG